VPATATDAWITTLHHLHLDGAPVPSRRGANVELLAYQTGMTQPLSRIASHPLKPLNVTTAVARFVWMIAGSDRLQDISFYEPRAARYSDDGLSVPGSSYGHRLLGSGGRTDQVTAAIRRLQLNPTTHRAAAGVWLADDAERISADIPCAFGLFFHIRSNELVATCSMRANNAFRLLPINLFEFSMLAEIVAVEVGAPLGTFVQWAASMHLFDTDRTLAKTLLAAHVATSVSMPPMPVDAFAQARRMAQWESSIRHCGTADTVLSTRSSARDDIHHYWASLLDVLVVHALRKKGYIEEAEEVGASVPSYLQVEAARGEHNVS